MTWVALSGLSGVSAVLAQTDAQQGGVSQSADMTHDKGDSIVRYDIIDVAKNMMSCAVYYDVIDESRSGDDFVEEVKWMFLVDASQTEEETASWIATAGGIFYKYWSDVKDDGSDESRHIIEAQRTECYNLGVSQQIFDESSDAKVDAVDE